MNIDVLARTEYTSMLKKNARKGSFFDTSNILYIINFQVLKTVGHYYAYSSSMTREFYDIGTETG